MAPQRWLTTSACQKLARSPLSCSLIWLALRSPGTGAEAWSGGVERPSAVCGDSSQSSHRCMDALLVTQSQPSDSPLLPRSSLARRQARQPHGRPPRVVDCWASPGDGDRDQERRDRALSRPWDQQSLALRPTASRVDVYSQHKVENCMPSAFAHRGLHQPEGGGGAPRAAAPRVSQLERRLRARFAVSDSELAR